MTVTRISPERWLDEENARETRTEYFDGEVVAMSGAAPKHDDVVSGIVSRLVRYEDEGGSCRHYATGNARVRTGTKYVYPDVVIACGPVFEPDPGRCLLNPVAVFEVLSPSTEAIDRGRKYEAYTAIPTMREYVLAEVDRPMLHVYRRVEDGWLSVLITGEEAILRLVSIGLDLPLRTIYRRRIEDGWRTDP